MKVQKLFGKITGVVVADGGSDLLYLQIGVLEKGGRLPNPLPVDKVDKGNAHVFAKLAGKVVGIYTQDLCSLLHGQVFVQMLLDIGDRQMHQRLQVGIGVFSDKLAVSLDRKIHKVIGILHRAYIFDLAPDLAGKSVQMVRMYAVVFQCVTELRVEDDAVVLEVS